MIEKVLKQCVGIDCSKDELVVCFGFMNSEFTIVHKALDVFPNDSKGLKKLLKWTEKLKDPAIPIVFVVEATGVYHENLAYFLVDEKQTVSVVLPNKINHFAQTLELKTVTDRVASKTIATFGLEKKLDAWVKPSPLFAHMKQLTREREQLKEERTVCQNQLHAEQHAAFPISSSIKRMQKRIKMLNEQIAEIEEEIKIILDENLWLKEKIDNLCTIPGVGLITAVTVVAETDGFNLIRNGKQLTSYAGFDVVDKSSGTSVRKKPRISKKGNKHLRKAMYFPAITNVKYDKQYQNLYHRIEAKSGIKMKGYTAIQRKLLLLMHALWKKNECYDPNYLTKKSNQFKLLEQPILTALTELDQVCS